MSHFKAKMHLIQFPASVRPSVCVLDWVWHCRSLAFSDQFLVLKWLVACAPTRPVQHFMFSLIWHKTANFVFVNNISTLRYNTRTHKTVEWLAKKIHNNVINRYAMYNIIKYIRLLYFRAVWHIKCRGNAHGRHKRSGKGQLPPVPYVFAPAVPPIVARKYYMYLLDPSRPLLQRKVYLKINEICQNTA